MAITNRIEVGKYALVTTDASFGVWQFSMWIKRENKHFRKSLRTKNLDLALQSVTIPLNLSYSKSGTSIVLKRE